MANFSDIGRYLQQTSAMQPSTLQAFFLNTDKISVIRSSNDEIVVRVVMSRFPTFNLQELRSSAFGNMKRNMAVLGNGKLKANAAVFEAINKAAQPDRQQNQPQAPVQVRIVDEEGRKIQEDAELAGLTEPEEKALDDALNQFRVDEMARLAQAQVKPPEHDKTDVSSSAEATSSQAVAAKKKSKNTDFVGNVGALRNADRTKAQREEQKFAARERAQEEKLANKEYVQARDKKQAIIDRDVKEHEQKRDITKRDLDNP